MEQSIKYCKRKMKLQMIISIILARDGHGYKQYVNGSFESSRMYACTCNSVFIYMWFYDPNFLSSHLSLFLCVCWVPSLFLHTLSVSLYSFQFQSLHHCLLFLIWSVSISFSFFAGVDLIDYASSIVSFLWFHPIYLFSIHKHCQFLLSPSRMLLYKT